MANQYFHIYGGNPTAGAVDGTVLSEDTELAPLTVTLDASANESKIIKLAIRTEQGYTGEAGASIKAAGANASLWSFGLSSGGAFTDNITIAGGIGSVNTIFYAKASSSSLESPGKDTSVDIQPSVKIFLVD